MFQFTTTTVINSNKDFTTGKPLWSTQEAQDDKPASLHVKRVMSFKAPNVSAIYKSVAVDPEMAKVTIDFSQVSGTKGDSFRLAIYIGLTQASQDSRYSNDLILKGKPLSVDFVWEDSAADTVKKLVKVINKYELMVYGDKLLKVSNNDTYLTIEAMNEYQRFRVLNIEKFDKDAFHGMGEYKVARSLEDLSAVDTNAEVTNSAEGYFVGKEGFGTYSFLLHNLRLPTSAHTRAFGIHQDETPIIGAKYNQYTVHYCTNRGVLGLNAVGDTVKSKTTHVFYVNTTVATEFENALKTVGEVIEVVEGEKTPDPDTIVSDIEALNKEIQTLKTSLSNKADKSEIADMETKTSAASTYATKESLSSKQDTISAGEGIELSGSSVSVKIDGDTLQKSASGLKVADGKFQPAE